MKRTPNKWQHRRKVGYITKWTINQYDTSKLIIIRFVLSFYLSHQLIFVFFSVLLLSDLRHLLSTWQWRISFVVFRQILCIMPVTCHSLKNASWTSTYRPMFLRYQTTHAFRLFPMHLNSQPLSFASRNRLDSLSDVFCCIPQAMFNIYWTTNF